MLTIPKYTRDPKYPNSSSLKFRDSSIYNEAIYIIVLSYLQV